jgi:hypothetical protein
MKPNIPIIAGALLIAVVATAKISNYYESTVGCVKCAERFKPEENKAGVIASTLAGGTAGALAGGAGGFYAGSGTGLALGPAGAVAGAPVGAAIGGVSVGIGGAAVGFWYYEHKLKCPHCGEVFENPKIK